MDITANRWNPNCRSSRNRASGPWGQQALFEATAMPLQGSMPSSDWGQSQRLPPPPQQHINSYAGTGSSVSSLPLGNHPERATGNPAEGILSLVEAGPRIETLKIESGDIMGTPSSPYGRYVVKKHKADIRGSSMLDTLQNVILNRVAHAVKECAGRHEIKRQLRYTVMHPDRSLSPHDQSARHFRDDPLDDDPRYGTPALVEDITRDVSKEIKTLCEGVAGTENDRCAELDGLLKQTSRKVNVLEEIIAGKDRGIKELQARLSEAVESSTTLETLTIKELVDKDTQADLIDPSAAIAATRNNDENHAGNNDLLIFPLGDNAAAANLARTHAARAVAAARNNVGHHGLKLLKVSDTGEELATLPPSAMIEHLTVVRAYRERLEKMEATVNEARAAAEAANKRTKDLDRQLREAKQELRDVDNNFHTSALSESVQAMLDRQMDDSNKHRDGTGNSPIGCVERTEAQRGGRGETGRDENATEGAGDNKNRPRAPSSNDDTAETEGDDVGGGGWGGYVSNESKADDTKLSNLPPRPTMPKKNRVRTARAFTRKHGEDEDFWSSGNTPPASTNRARGIRRTGKTEGKIDTNAVIRSQRAAVRANRDTS